MEIGVQQDSVVPRADPHERTNVCALPRARAAKFTRDGARTLVRVRHAEARCPCPSRGVTRRAAPYFGDAAVARRPVVVSGDEEVAVRVRRISIGCSAHWPRTARVHMLGRFAPRSGVIRSAFSAPYARRCRWATAKTRGPKTSTASRAW